MADRLVHVNGGDSGTHTAVVLPCSPDQFSQFIAALLGRPQELTGIRHGQFSADKAEAMQLYHLITQRVAQQHGTHPLQFTASIQFDNGTSVLLNSVDEFQNYHEVRAVRSLGVLLTWTFLLAFPGKATPEKQEIEFGYVAELRSWDDMEREVSGGTGRGFVHYRIRHTARTWGADIESLLSHYVDTLIKPEDKFRATFRKNSVVFGVTVGALLFTMLMGGLGLVSSRVLEEQNSLLAPVIGEAVPLAAKLDQIINFLASTRDSVRGLYTTLYMLFSLAGSVATGVWIGSQANAYPPSDVILTKRAETVHKERLSKYERGVRKIIVTTLSAFVIGVLGNISYDFLVKDAVRRVTTSTSQDTGAQSSP